MAKTAQFFQIKIIIYKRRQKVNPNLILGNTSYNKRWPPKQIEHLQNSLKLAVSAHFLKIFHNISFRFESQYVKVHNGGKIESYLF